MVAGDEILLAAGKTPNTAALGLDRAAVQVDERQAIRVDPAFRRPRRTFTRSAMSPTSRAGWRPRPGARGRWQPSMR
jgi:hypothetical protein